LRDACLHTSSLRAMSEWLKSVHFYRKVPRDLTEATLAGGTISLLSSIVMAYLFISNFSAPVLSEAGPAWPASAAQAADRPRRSGQPEAWPRVESRLRRASWPEPEPASFRLRRT
jgi:hypothetical protein